MFFRTKKTEIHRRAKRLLNAFSTETRRESLDSVVRGQRKLIRAHYEKGLLVFKEDFIRSPAGNRPTTSLQFQIIDDLLGILKNELQRRRANKKPNNHT